MPIGSASYLGSPREDVRHTKAERVPLNPLASSMLLAKPSRFCSPSIATNTLVMSASALAPPADDRLATYEIFGTP